jgi:hypothetical protein
MSRKIYLHMQKSGMIKEKSSQPYQSKFKHISQDPTIKFTLKRYTK